MLDTKYKRDSNPKKSDIQQIVAYALSMETENAFLIYPSPDTTPNNFTIGNQVKVAVLYFDISSNIEQAGKEFINQLESHLEMRIS